MELQDTIVLIYGKKEDEIKKIIDILPVKEENIRVCLTKKELNTFISTISFDLIFVFVSAKDKNKIKSIVEKIHKDNISASLCLIGETESLNDVDADYFCTDDDLNNKKYILCIYQNALRKKRQSELAAMLVHDLRSPLQSLMSYLELIETEVFGEINEGQHKMVTHAISVSEDIEEMLEELSEIYQYEQKNFRFSMQKTNLKSLIDMTLPALWVLADKKNIKFNPQIVSELPVVNIDVQAIYRVLINLVSNAINHSPENSLVRLNVQLVEKTERTAMVQFKIIDSGQGIEPEMIHHVFDKFYRLKSNNGDKKSGYGLGLYISKLIVNAHGGSIGAYNNREGGMTFYFTLPVL